MKRDEINGGLDLVGLHYEEVVRRLMKQKTRNQRKCDYKDVLDFYMAGRNFAETGRAFGLSRSGAHDVVRKAIRIAESVSKRRKR